jgi:hypothetical protein
MDRITFNSSAAVTLFYRHQRHSGLFVGWNTPVSSAKSARAIFCRDRGRNGVFGGWRASPEGSSAVGEPQNERAGFDGF